MNHNKPISLHEQLEQIDDLAHAIQMEQKGNITYQSARDGAWLRILTTQQTAHEAKLEEIMRVDIGDASPTRLALQAYLETLSNKDVT